MGYLVSAAASSNYCTIPNQLTCNAGTDSYSVEFSAAFPVALAADRFLIGVGSGTALNGFQITSSGRLQIYAGGTNRYFTAGGFVIFDATFRTYRLEHDSGGAWRAYRDGTLVSSGTFSTSVAFAALGLFFRIHPTSSGYLGGNFEYIETTGLSNSARWSADLSGGTGSVWPTVGGTNGAALINYPTDNSQWQGFSSGSGTIQNILVNGAKQQDTAASIAVSASQLPTVVTANQVDRASTLNVLADQSIEVLPAKQQDVATATTVGANQSVIISPAKQQDSASIISVTQSSPGAQAVIVAAAKQQDAASQLTVSASQSIVIGVAQQTDQCSNISAAINQLLNVASAKQQDSAAAMPVASVQVLSVAQAKQVDRATVSAVLQYGPITRVIDRASLQISLSTSRAHLERSTKQYSAQLDTSRYSIARA